MQLPTRLPFGILCIFFTHYARVTAVCPTLPCSENAPVYGMAPSPVYTDTSSGLAGDTPLGDAPLTSTAPPAVKPPATKAPIIPNSPPVGIPSTSSTSTSVLSPTTASSTAPSSTPSLIPPAATPTSTASAEPTVISSPSSSLEPPTITPLSSAAASSKTTFPVTQSTTTLSVGSAVSNSSASVTVPASITQCGSCRVWADQVQVYYWPTASVKKDCARGASLSPFQTGVPYASNASRIQALAPQVADDPTTNVVDGYTFTFPSLYVSVIGGISVSDSCGFKGSLHTNPAPVAVQAITTASYPNWPSTCRPQGQNAEAVIDTLALSDIACPTWGLSDPFTTSCDGSSYMTETYGPPYNPVILVPTELMSIDPAWAACTTDPANALLTLPCGIYDPPIALSTASAMVPGGASGDPLDPEDLPSEPAAAPHQAGRLSPSVTPVNDPPTPTRPMAVPANAGSPSLPDPTTVPSSSSSDPSAKPSQDGFDPNAASDPAAELHKLDPVAPSGKQSGDSSQNNPGQEGVQAPAADQQTSGSNDPGSTSQQKEASDPASGSQVSDPNGQQAVPQAPTTINLGGGSQSTQGVGALINGGLGKGSVPAPAHLAAFTPHAITALGQTLSITDPAAVVIAGSTLSVGGPAHTSDGKYYSLAPSGNLIAGMLAPSPGPSSPPVLSVAGSTYTANSATAFVVAGQTLTPGGQINVGSTPVSLHPSADVAVVGGSTQLLTTPAPSPNPAVLKYAGSTYTANSASAFVVAGQTLTPGGKIAVDNTPISLDPSAGVAVVGGSTQVLTTPGPNRNAGVMTFAGSTYTANAASQFVVAGQTLTPGGQITVSNTPLSLAPSANLAVIGSSTQLLTSATPTSNPAILTFGGSTYTANSASQFIIVGQTLPPGGTITASGTPISIPKGTNIAIIGSSTQILTTPVLTAKPAILTFAGSTYTENSASQFIIAGQTLTPGGTITASGTTISMPQGTNIAVIGASTQTLATAPPLTKEAPVLTWHGSTYTADASSDFVIDSQTLTPGGIITVLGTPIRLASGATDAVVGSSTQTLASAVITPADIVTIGGQLVTANPTGFAVAGTTVLPGGKGVLVDGTMVSLAPGGTLFVGNSSVVLPTDGPGASAGPVAFEGGKEKLGIPSMEWVGAYVALLSVPGGLFLVL